MFTGICYACGISQEEIRGYKAEVYRLVVRVSSCHSARQDVPSELLAFRMWLHCTDNSTHQETGAARLLLSARIVLPPCDPT